MQLTSVILEQLDREAELTRRARERVPKGKNGWKPHPSPYRGSWLTWSPRCLHGFP